MSKTNVKSLHLIVWWLLPCDELLFYVGVDYFGHHLATFCIVGTAYHVVTEEHFKVTLALSAVTHEMMLLAGILDHDTTCVINYDCCYELIPIRCEQLGYHD